MVARADRDRPSLRTVLLLYAGSFAVGWGLCLLAASSLLRPSAWGWVSGLALRGPLDFGPTEGPLVPLVVLGILATASIGLLTRRGFLVGIGCFSAFLWSAFGAVNFAMGV